MLGQTRSTYRYIPKPLPDEDSLTGRIIELVSQYGRYGYQLILRPEYAGRKMPPEDSGRKDLTFQAYLIAGLAFRIFTRPAQ